MKTVDSGDWGEEHRTGSMMMGNGVPISRTTSDEEEEDGVLEVKGHTNKHVHRTGSSPLASPPTTGLGEESGEARVDHIPHDTKVAGHSIHKGHAHAIPDHAGEIESNKTAKDLVGTTTKAGASYSANHDDDEDDENQRIPGAFIWDKVKAALP
jgi:hypothetical protein